MPICWPSFPTHVLLALLRDGFHPEAPGGRVKLRSDGSAVLDYPLTGFVMEGARRALLAMAELQFASGAKEVLPVHEMAQPYTSWAQAQGAIAALPMKPLLTKVVSAHVMGAAAWRGARPRAWCAPMAGTGRSRTCRCMTARFSRPAWAPTRSVHLWHHQPPGAGLVQRLTGASEALA